MPAGHSVAPTGPEAGSDPRALRMNYRRDWDRIRLAGMRSMVSLPLR